MPQIKGAKEYKLEFTVLGLGDLTVKELRVIVQREDGSTFERTTLGGEVVVLDGDLFLIGVKIKDGDLTAEGTYRYQVWDETNGARVKTNIGSFIVGETLNA
jgi:hypothetical protein